MDFIDGADRHFRISRVPFYNDEPKIYQYTAALRSGLPAEEVDKGYGSDIVKECARKKAVCEALERDCLRLRDASRIAKFPSHGLPKNLIAPERLSALSDYHLDLLGLRQGLDEEAVASFSWVLGRSMLSDLEVWVPAQTIFCPFDSSGEPLLRLPSSNGAACGASVLEACCRGALEVVERDAFMCWYLSASPARRLSLEALNHPGLEQLSVMYDRYNLDLIFILLSSRWQIPVVLCVIFDKTGVGPGLTVGLKCHPCLATAILGSAFEAQQMRPWLRDKIALTGCPEIDAKDIGDYWARALYWAAPERYKELEFLWAELPLVGFKEASAEFDVADMEWGRVWEFILGSIRQAGAELVTINLTGGVCAQMGLHVVKVLVPQAHPLYMDERLPYLRSESLSASLSLFGPRWPSLSGTLLMPPHPLA